MIVAGAGGHALEVFDVLLTLGYSADQICFYEDYSDTLKLNNCRVLKNTDELKKQFETSRNFCLGVGNPILRLKMYDLMIKSGGLHNPIVSPSAVISNYSINKGADVMPQCFISSQTILGKGSLINTRANLHHGVVIDKFTELAPSVVLLGKVKVGCKCSIGANATVLPRVIIKDEVVVGAGAVVIGDIESKRLVKGVPAK